MGESETLGLSVRGRRAIALFGLLAVGVVACDPCFGTLDCSTTARVTIDGQIVRAENGGGVDGVRIDVIRVGGVALATDSVSSVTSGGGHWRVSIPASSSGTVLADIAVTSPLVHYRVPAVALRTSTSTGDGNVLDRWVVYPDFQISAQLELRGTDGQPLSNAAIEFRRSAGVQLFGPAVADSVFHGMTDAAGRVPFFNNGTGVFATSLGSLFGDLTVVLASGSRVTTHGIRVDTRYDYHPPLGVSVIGVGPAIHWVLETVNRATGQPQGGVRVTYTRTGGIAATPSSFTAISNSDGHVDVPLQALEDGTLTGDLAVTPPAPGMSFTRSGFQLTTFDGDGSRFLGVIPVMPYLPYSFGVKIGETGVSDVVVDFKRTGGIPLQNDLVTARSSLGSAGLHPIPLAQGDVIGDLTIHAPAPYPSFIVHNLRLSTVDGDGVVPDRLIYVWGLDGPPSGPPGTTVEILPP